MTSSWQISRRTVLRGLGTAMALPLLEAMSPALALAAEEQKKAVRMAFVYVPNGAHMPEWTPKDAGTDFEFPYILEPMKPFKDDLLVLTGLAQDKGRANGDGAGDHARSLASFLTGAQPKKTHGADIRVGISVDQLAAQKVGHATKFPSLEIGCEAGPQSGNCDSGYSCAYSNSISWRSESTPVAKEIDPRLVFERLFSNGKAGEAAESRSKREIYQKSILDLVLDDAQRLKRRLGAKDQQKMEEYLSSVRELELRIARADNGDPAEHPDFPTPQGIPKDYGEHIRIMSDLLVLAFQGDLTRISTFVLANEGSNRSYPFINVRDGHHDLSHHGGNAEKQRKIRDINRFHMEQFAYLLEKLRAVPEGEGTLLDNCMIVYGSGLSDGNRHQHHNLPILLAGRGGRTIDTGRHVRLEHETPLNNLYLSMLDRLGSPVDQLGDSSGRLTVLTA